MSSLHPPQMDIPLEEGLSLYECQDAVQAFLNQKGISAPTAPTIQTTAGTMTYQGSLPPDLVVLSDDQLGTLLNQLAAWGDFVQYQLAEADMNKTKAEEELGLTEAKIRLTYRYDAEGKKMTIQERDDHVKTDRRYVQAKSRCVYFEAIYKILRAIAHSSEANWHTVSRRITQRGQDLERDRRNAGVQQGQPTVPMFRRT